MAPEVKTAKNSKLPKLSENCFEPVGKGGWPPISIWITILIDYKKNITVESTAKIFFEQVWVHFNIP
jgi:hypothetical protein